MNKVKLSLRRTIKNREEYEEAKADVIEKLLSIDVHNIIFPAALLKAIAEDIGVSGMTIRNYLSGEVKDGYLGELIYEMVYDTLRKHGVLDKRSAKRV